MSESAEQRPHVVPIQRWGRAAFPIPDGLLALVFAMAAAMDFLTPEQLASLPHQLFAARNDLMFGLMVEGGFLLMQGTLVDIASRLRKRPPVWAIVLIAGAVLLLSNEARDMLRYAWALGAVVFVPLLLSLAERATILWRLPGKTREQKIAARALIANRITTGLALFGVLTVVMLVDAMLQAGLFGSSWLTLAAGAVYFAVAAFDDWRVRGRRFAEKPTVLFRFDPMHITHLDPL